jgi:ABC-type antimicrobial peptide transport system permease subunit
VCALDGCENRIEITPGQARRYCCVAHRKIARKQRRDHGSTDAGGLSDADETGDSATGPMRALPAAEGSDPDAPQRGFDPPTVPIPVLRAARAEGSGPPYRRLVPAPSYRWYRRSRGVPYAARGIRPRFARRPMRMLPDWLRSASLRTLDPAPRALPPPRQERRVVPRQEYDPRLAAPPLPGWVAPYAPATAAPAAGAYAPAPAAPAAGAGGPFAVTPAMPAVPVGRPAPVEPPAPAPVEPPVPVESAQPPAPAWPTAVPTPRAAVLPSRFDTPTPGPTTSDRVAAAVIAAVAAVAAGMGLLLATCRDAIGRCVQLLATLFAAPLAALLADRKSRSTAVRTKRQQRRAEEEDQRKDAAAVLAGTPLAGEVTTGKRRGRRVAQLVKPMDLPNKAPWLGQMREALYAALHSLAVNRLRSLLTTVGIIAGVASVIVLVAMGDGMTKGVNDQWSQYATQITITPITGAVATGKAPQHLTDTDLRALRDPKATPDVATWSPAVVSNNVTLAVGQQKAGSQLYGISQNYLELDNRHMIAGTWFTDAQMTAGARQAVLGPQVVNELWGPGTDPTTVIGKPLRVGHSTFLIQGVVNSDGQNDDVVMVPLTTARAFVVGDDGGKLNIIIAKSTSIDTLDAAKNEIFAVLYAQHHVRVDTDRDFNVSDNTNILNQQSQSVRFLSMFIVAIAAISLFVGGVGVANIMLVSVTERTREIGIRKAIGAPRRAIMRQFLSEAVMLTTLGGLVGIVLGVGLCELGKIVIPKLWPPDPASLTPTPIPILSLNPVLLAFGVSVVIGLLAGGYPAYRASRLRPIEALRFE